MSNQALVYSREQLAELDYDELVDLPCITLYRP